MERAEERLRGSEERWKAVFENSPTMYFIVDAAGITVSVNAFGAEQLGYTPDELVGSPVLNVFYEPDREAVQRNVGCCLAQLNRTMSWEARKVRKDGKVLRVREMAKSVLFENSPVILVMCEVIAEQKRAEEAARTLEILNKAGSALALESDLHRLVQVVTDAGVELTGAEFGAFFYNVKNEENESYMLYTLSGAPVEAFSKFPMPRNTAVFAPTFNGEGIVRSDDIKKDPRYGQNKPHAGMPEGHLPVRSYLAVPVTSRSGEVLGGLFFGHADAGVFTERSELGLLGLAAQAAVAIDNARLSQATEREMEQRRRAEEAIRLLNATLEQQVAERTEALSRSERYLAEAQTLSHTGSWAVNPATGKAIYWSQEMFRIYGLDPERSRAPDREEFSRFLLPEDRDRVLERIDAAYREKAEYTIDHRIVLSDGIVKHLHVIGHPVLDHTGAAVEYIGTSLDVTERKRAEEALQKAHAELAHVARVTTVGALTSSIAHEVNQPLAAIVAGANAAQSWLAAQPPNLHEAREALGDIVRDGLRASDVIGRVRALLKKTPTLKERVDVNDLIEDSIPLLQSEVRRHRILLRTELAPGLPPVIGDRVQLQQVILNLVMNGIEAMKDVTEVRELLIQSRSDATGTVLVAVQDSGVGLEPQEVERVFEAFYTTKPKGMGMGLTICRSIIGAHGGRLWAAANEPRGAVFQFTLPDEVVPAEHAGAMQVV